MYGAYAHSVMFAPVLGLRVRSFILVSMFPFNRSVFQHFSQDVWLESAPWPHYDGDEI